MECHHPNWRSPSFFRGVGLNHQPVKMISASWSKLPSWSWLDSSWLRNRPSFWRLAPDRSHWGCIYLRIPCERRSGGLSHQGLRDQRMRLWLWLRNFPTSPPAREAWISQLGDKNRWILLVPNDNYSNQLLWRHFLGSDGNFFGMSVSDQGWFWKGL